MNIFLFRIDTQILRKMSLVIAVECVASILFHTPLAYFKIRIVNYEISFILGIDDFFFFLFEFSF